MDASNEMTQKMKCSQIHNKPTKNNTQKHIYFIVMVYNKWERDNKNKKRTNKQTNEI